MVDYALMNQNLYEGKAKEVEQMTKDALAEGRPVQEILTEGLIAGMSVVGEDFKHNVIYVPEVLIAARAMKAGMEILRPLLAEAKIEPLGRAAIGTVKGDLHDIGKNLVAMMLEGAGFEIIDLGIDVSPEKFIEAVKEKRAQIICMSALLTTTMPSMKTTIEAVKEAGLRDRVKVLIGGAPVTQAYAQEIGADGYAPDAASAADRAKELIVAA